MLDPKYTSGSGNHAPTYFERKPWLVAPTDNVLSHNLKVVGKALRGEYVSIEEAVVTFFTSLMGAAALIPLAIVAGGAGLEEAKKRGIIK